MGIEILYDLFSVVSLAPGMCLACSRPSRNSHWMNQCTNGSPAPLGQSIPALCSWVKVMRNLKLSCLSWASHLGDDKGPDTIQIWAWEFGLEKRSGSWFLGAFRCGRMCVSRSSEATLKSLILHCRAPMPIRRCGCSQPMWSTQSIVGVKAQALEINRLMFKSWLF